VVAAGHEARCRAEILEPYGLTVRPSCCREARIAMPPSTPGCRRAPADTDLVLVHDGARPLITPPIIRAAVQTAGAEEGGGGRNSGDGHDQGGGRRVVG